MFFEPKIKSYFLKQTKCSGKTFCVVLSASPGFLWRYATTLPSINSCPLRGRRGQERRILRQCSGAQGLRVRIAR